IQMPRMSGLDALQRLRSDGSALPCLFVTTFGEDDYIAEAIRLDADGFVLKSGDPRQLIAGVHAGAGRGAFFSPSVGRRLLASGVSTTSTQYASAVDGVDRLPARARESLVRLSHGATGADVATALH